MNKIAHVRKTGYGFMHCRLTKQNNNKNEKKNTVTANSRSTIYRLFCKTVLGQSWTTNFTIPHLLCFVLLFFCVGPFYFIWKFWMSSKYAIYPMFCLLIHFKRDRLLFRCYNNLQCMHWMRNWHFQILKMKNVT